MVRKIIHIDESKCNGCGACAMSVLQEKPSRKPACFAL